MIINKFVFLSELSVSGFFFCFVYNGTKNSGTAVVDFIFFIASHLYWKKGNVLNSGTTETRLNSKLIIVFSSFIIRELTNRIKNCFLLFLLNFSFLIQKVSFFIGLKFFFGF